MESTIILEFDVSKVEEVIKDFIEFWETNQYEGKSGEEVIDKASFEKFCTEVIKKSIK